MNQNLLSSHKSVLKVIVLAMFFIFVFNQTLFTNTHFCYAASEESTNGYFNNEIISEEFFNNHGTVMLIIHLDSGKIVAANQAALDFYGYDQEALAQITIQEINTLTPSQVKEEMINASLENRNHFIFQHQLKDTAVRTVEVYSYPFEANGQAYLYSIIIDITEQIEAQESVKRTTFITYIIGILSILLLIIIIFFLHNSLKKLRQTQKKLKENEESYQYLFNRMHEGYALHALMFDDKGQPYNCKFLKVNDSYEEYTGLKRNDIIGKDLFTVLPDTEQELIDSYAKVALEGEQLTIENYSAALEKYFTTHVYNAGYGKFITVIIDTTETKEKETQIQFLNYHDQLTGLYNRRYMEKMLLELDTPTFLPFSIIIADVNGLKLTNDAFGHQQGDLLLTSIADIFRSTFRDDDIVARIGGDEFLILLPNTDQKKALAMTKRLEDKISHTKMEPIMLSVSIGDATKNNVDNPLTSIYKKAEDQMYHKKLTQSYSIRSKMIHHIFDVIEKDYDIISQHQNRVSYIAKSAIDIYNLNIGEGEKLVKAALYHDIGLVAIDNSIPNKTDELTIDEWDEIKRHSECGYRILSAITEYAEIATLILAHHEWYDGTGYPKGLRGTEIPYLSRILSILDAYDAMTHQRFYKKVLCPKEAIEELKSFSGTQFDPDLVELFIDNYIKKHL